MNFFTKVFSGRSGVAPVVDFDAELASGELDRDEDFPPWQVGRPDRNLRTFDIETIAPYDHKRVLLVPRWDPAWFHLITLGLKS